MTLNVYLALDRPHQPLSLRKQAELLMFIEDACNGIYIGAMQGSGSHLVHCQTSIFSIDAYQFPFTTGETSLQEFRAQVARDGSIYETRKVRVGVYLEESEGDTSIQLVEGVFRYGMSMVYVLARLRYYPELPWDRFRALSAVVCVGQPITS